MNRLIVVAIFVGIGWYGNSLYQHNRLPFLKELSFGLFEEPTKCITKDGEVIYGSASEGTVCERIEKVNGSLAIVDNETYRSTERTPYDQDAHVSNFRCDGRIYCSQMRSCEEATFFLKNCPNVKMDGNHDGIPCESQWCKW